MRAIILAAGAGTRLSPLTDDCPKCLVAVGDRPLLDYQIGALRAAGVDDIVIVVGYRAEQVRGHCGAACHYVENPDFATTNSIYSLFLAAAYLDTDTFLFNCDILFDPEIVRRMLASEAPNAVAVDGRVRRVAGEMNVECGPGGVVRHISKELDPDRASAQSVQLVRFDTAGAGVVREEVERMVARQERQSFPTAAYGSLLASGRLYAVECGDLPWAEIDSVDDHRHAQTNVLPRLGSG